MFPQKLKSGDEVRIIAPSHSLSIISEGIRAIAHSRFADLGLKMTFGKHVEETDEFTSSSIESRIEDLHDAFRDKSVKAVFAVIGGFNSNQLLRYIDWDLIKNNPKIFCGYSDTTALQNAMYAKTRLVTYSGPAYSTFGQELYFDYTLDYVKKCLFTDKAFDIQTSEHWTDDFWWKNQHDRNLIKNDGPWVINEGAAQGTLLGGNLCTLNLLQGTEYFPNIDESILFLEDDEEADPNHFDRDLQSLIHQSSFQGVKGLVIGRFQKTSGMTKELLTKIIRTKRELNSIPIVANIDFGHTSPLITFPIGGAVEVQASSNSASISILKH
ncbi:MAG TPA: S66 peptidase family protein [Patescibacteria group bacterium]|nr:S66 peptidase family protein [Patescibacteria group bacterium]